jgi:dihydrofolate synthase/folylpolyglutamate synthase
MEDFNAIDYLMTFGKSGKPVKDLSRIEKLLSDLDSPQRDLRFIHIAGTNGKGSVLEMTASALTKAGYRTGRLTSPFIRRYTDRIRIDGREIDETALEKYCRRIAGLEVTKDCSQFEITLAAALLWFRDSACDFQYLTLSETIVLNTVSNLEFIHRIRDEILNCWGQRTIFKIRASNTGRT